MKPSSGLPGCREHSRRGHQGEGGPEEGVGAPTLLLAAGAGLARRKSKSILRNLCVVLRLAVDVNILMFDT